MHLYVSNLPGLLQDLFAFNTPALTVPARAVVWPLKPRLLTFMVFKCFQLASFVQSFLNIAFYKSFPQTFISSSLHLCIYQSHPSCTFPYTISFI